MSWQRGLFRLWALLSIVWFALVTTFQVSPFISRLPTLERIAIGFSVPILLLAVSMFVVWTTKSVGRVLWAIFSLSWVAGCLVFYLPVQPLNLRLEHLLGPSLSATLEAIAPTSLTRAAIAISLPMLIPALAWAFAGFRERRHGYEQDELTLDLQSTDSDNASHF